MRSTIIPALYGTLALIIWSFVLNSVFHFTARIDINRLEDESVVYEVLETHVTVPGRYSVNPDVEEGAFFPPETPVYSVLYSGLGHEHAGMLMWLEMLLFFLCPLIAVWLIRQTSQVVQKSYWRKLLIFVAIGFLIALFDLSSNLGIGGYPIKETLLLTIYDIGAWSAVGLVTSWRL